MALQSFIGNLSGEPTLKASSAIDPKKSSDKYITEVLQNYLPKSERSSLPTDLKWNFILDRHKTFDKKPKPLSRKKQFLTRSQRKYLNLLKLPKGGWDYDDMQKIRDMWKGYMQACLSSIKKTPSCEDACWSNLGSTLAKIEFIGAEITVIRSSVPSTIGIVGTVILETKSTFQVVTPNSKLKVLLKQPSVFAFDLDGRRFTIFGKHLIMRPNDRSVKKIKLTMLPDL